MKVWPVKKVAIALLGIVVLSQIPFAWRRYRLRRLHHAIAQLANQRAAPQTPSRFRDFKGVIHVHSFLGGHSTGTFEAIVSAAKANQLDFVIMTEHPAKEYDTAAMTLNDFHGSTLFVSGNEVSTSSSDRLLLIPGAKNAATANTKSTEAISLEQKTAGGLAIVAYPAEFKSWQAAEFDGVEVYNLFTNARRINPVVTFFDGLWSYGNYPDLMFANFYERPSEALQLWDNSMMANSRRIVATAGNDAHANVGLSLNDSSGKQIVGFKLDPYERSFRVVRTHVLLGKDQPLTRDTLLAAIAAGHCYFSFDLFGDPQGFEFTTQDGSGVTMGDEIHLASGLKLAVTLPLSGKVVLFRDGTRVDEESGVTQKEFTVAQAGAYRVEVYLPQLPSPVTNQPWIVSNPIYVR
ncbi:MAG: hypothetical protein QOE77_2859 [Blastocatellia bacterium]|nr:hypothetical protein [Blastocatellia bacterium]